MPSRRTLKKQHKELVNEYYQIVSPGIKNPHTTVPKDILRPSPDQFFEIFSLYERDGWTTTSNSTPYVTPSKT